MIASTRPALEQVGFVGRDLGLGRIPRKDVVQTEGAIPEIGGESILRRCRKQAEQTQGSSEEQAQVSLSHSV